MASAEVSDNDAAIAPIDIFTDDYDESGTIISDHHDSHRMDDRKRRDTTVGRQKSDMLNLFTEAVCPNKLKEDVCRHCKSMVKYHKKPELARLHLLKCLAFRNYVKSLSDVDIPYWYPRKKKEFRCLSF